MRNRLFSTLRDTSVFGERIVVWEIGLGQRFVNPFGPLVLQLVS